MVIQRAIGKPDVDFYRNSCDYICGFGDKEKEFWLGNKQVHQLTKTGDKKLRIELEGADGRTAWAEYHTFKVESEANRYILNATGFSGGTAGDCFDCPQFYKGNKWFSR